MIICTACGRPNDDDSEFCEDCGRYLAWVGEHVDVTEEEQEEEPEEAPEAPPPPRPGLWRRMGMALGIGRHPSEPEAPTVPAGSDESRPVHTEDRPLEEASTSGGPRDAAMEDLTPGEVPMETGPEEPDTIVLHDPTASSPSAWHPSAPSIAPVMPLRPVGSGVSGSLALDRTTEERPPIAMRRPNEAESDRSARQRRRSAPSPLASGPDTPRPGDIYCGVCNQFNDPARMFCRRCGAELVHPSDAEAAPQYDTMTFWQRHRRRDLRITSAGERPGRWGKAASGGGSQGMGMRVMARVGSVVVGLAIVISFIGPAAQPLKNWYSKVYHSVINKVDVSYVQQFAIGANASSSTPGHPASLAVDDADNTYWMSLPDLKTNAVGSTITVVFATPTSINRIGFLSGISTSEQAFLSQCRPEDITISWGHSKLHERLQDESSFQRLDVNIPPVLSITFRVNSVYTSVKGHRIAITEIEFFQRS